MNSNFKRKKQKNQFLNHLKLGDLITLKDSFFQYFEKFLPLLSNLENTALLNLQLFPKKSFNLIKLDHNFGDLCKIYLHRKCEICLEFPSKGEICICLICNIVLCSISCRKNGKPKINGALGDHAQERHAGNSVFLGVFSCKVYWIASPRNFQDECKKND